MFLTKKEEQIVAQNPNNIELYNLSASRGNSEGQWRLGSMYERGLGGASQDYKKAFECFYKASEQGDATSCYYMALLYFNGNICNCRIGNLCCMGLFE